MGIVKIFRGTAKLFLPLIHRTDQLRALVVGGGEVALRKVKDLLAAGTTITVLAPDFQAEMAGLAEAKGIELIEREFRPGDTEGYGLIVVATDHPAVNREVSLEARKAGLPVNVVDQPELCTVYFPAVVRRDPLMVSISTGGSAPFFARELKRSLVEWLDKGWSLRARWAARLREFVREHVDGTEQRESLFHRFMQLQDSELDAWKEDNPPYDLWRRWIDELRMD